MKQKLLITSLLLLFIFSPLNVYALSGTIKIVCDKTTLTLNDSTTCHITATTDDEVSSIHSIINVSDGLELTKVTVDDIWEGDNDKVLDLYTADNKKDAFAIADFVVNAVKTGTQEITLTDTTLGDKSFNEHNFTVSPYSITVNGLASSSSSSKVSSSSSNKSSSSAGANQSSSSSLSSSSKSSSSSSSSLASSSSSSSKQSSSSNVGTVNKILYTVELDNDQVYLGEYVGLSFVANTPGIIRVTIENPEIMTVSSSTYNVETYETKNFKLKGIKIGSTIVTLEFIPNDNTKYETIMEKYNITVKEIVNNNTNVDENPPTGTIIVLLVAIIGLAILGHSCWYHYKNKQC